MELSNTRIVPAPPAAVWSALNDPAVLKECLPGCELFERTGDGAFQVVMAARVGPVSARFNGRMTMSNIDPPKAYTLHFEGQGGAAGFARGEARVSLAPEGVQQTAMTYVAKAQVGGKLAPRARVRADHRVLAKAVGAPCTGLHRRGDPRNRVGVAFPTPR